MPDRRNVCCWVLAAAFVAAAGYAAWAQMSDGPSDEQRRRASAVETLTALADSLRRRATTAERVARRDSARAARLRATLDTVRVRERRRRRDAAVRAAAAGDSLTATIDSIDAIAANPAVRDLADTARAQFSRHLDADSVRVASFEAEIAATDSARRAERRAKISWRRAFVRKDSQLVVAEARADTLAASVDYWRGEARTSLVERFAGSYTEAVGKAAVEALACHPETGGVEECLFATGMLVVDAVTEGL